MTSTMTNILFSCFVAVTINWFNCFAFNLEQSYVGEIGNGNYKVSGAFGCQGLKGCNDTYTYLTVNGTCINPKLTVYMVETDFGSSDYLTRSKFYLNGDYIGYCNGIGTGCTDDWITCQDMTLLNISQYFDIDSYSNTFEFIFDSPYIYFGIDDGCPYSQASPYNSSQIIDYQFYGRYVISCDIIENDNNNSNITTPSPTLAPTSVDYYFDVTYGNTTSNSIYSTEESFGCLTRDCQATRIWQINGVCLNPKLSVSIVETHFSGSNRYADIYINDDFISRCDDLDESRTWDWVDCTSVQSYSIDDYLDKYNSYTDYIKYIVNGNDGDSSSNDDLYQYIEITLDISYYVTVYWYKLNGIYYLLYGTVTIDCDTPQDAYNSITKIEQFNVGSSEDYYQISNEFGCSEKGCTATMLYEINRNESDCINPRLTVSVMETDFANKNLEKAYIYINNDYYGSCEPLKHDCNFEFVKCDGITDLNVSSYVNNELYMTNNGMTSNLLITVEATEYIDFCPYSNSSTSSIKYYLYAKTTLTCDVPDGQPTSYPTTPTTTTTSETSTAMMSTTAESPIECSNSNSSDTTYSLLTVSVQFDAFVGDTNWTVIDSNDTVLIKDGTVKSDVDKDYAYLLKEDTACINQDNPNSDLKCFEFIMDVGGASDDSDNFTRWFSIEYGDNSYVTWNGEQSFESYEKSDEIDLYFCQSFIKNGTNNLTIVIDYDTTVKIFNDDQESTQFSELLYKNYIVIDENSDDSEGDTSDDSSSSTLKSFELMISDGCYEITMYNAHSTDEEDNTYDDVAHELNVETVHGLYTIYVNNKIVAYGGYYDTSESNTFCTNSENDFSYCIIPQECLDKEIIFENENDAQNATIIGYSYQSFPYAYFIAGNNNFQPSYFACLGTMSCLEFSFLGGFDDTEPAADVWCMGAFSCLDANVKVMHVLCLGVASCVSLNATGNGYHDYYNIFYFEAAKSMSGQFLLAEPTGDPYYLLTEVYPGTSLSMLHTTIVVEPWIILQLSIPDTWYALYNVTLTCHVNSSYVISFVNITCDGEGDYEQWFMIDNNCYDTVGVEILKDSNCNFIKKQNLIDNSTIHLINKIETFIDDSQYFIENCGKHDNISDNCNSYDIGYPLYVSDIIYNDLNNGDITCNGYQSCAFADTIKTDYGSIYCSAYQSCIDTNVIWTETSDEYDNQGNVACLARYSCAGTVIEAAGDIFCGTDYACYDTSILSGQKLYCMGQACTNSVIKKVETIYFIEKQGSSIIYSSNIVATNGVSKIYFIGSQAGYGVNYFCDTGDFCYITCAFGACSSESTLLHCDGKCFIDCDDTIDGNECPQVVTSLSPSAAPSSAPSSSPSQPPTAAPSNFPTRVPSNAPTLPPTDAPTPSPSDSLVEASTETSFVTEDDLNSYFNYVLMVLVGLTLLLVILGVSDAKCTRKNELFHPQSIFIFAFYTNDFISDVFFSVRLLLYATDEGWSSDSIYMYLFLMSLVFIFVPLIANMTQLYFEIAKWTSNPMLKQTLVPRWIQANMKVLFMLSILCGSSFSAIQLVNSHLFQMKLFQMNLDSYHISIFQNKRFFSIVIFENIPQLAIQIVTLILTTAQGETGSGLLITIFSMLFTIISIFLSAFEYFLGNQFYKSDEILVFQFNLENSAITQMKPKEFTAFVMNRRNKVIANVSRLLGINKEKIERLAPVANSKGAKFTFMIQSDATSIKHLESTLANAINDGSLGTSIKTSLKLDKRAIVDGSSVTTYVMKKGKVQHTGNLTTDILAMEMALAPGKGMATGGATNTMMPNTDSLGLSTKAFSESENEMDVGAAHGDIMIEDEAAIALPYVNMTNDGNGYQNNELQLAGPPSVSGNNDNNNNIGGVSVDGPVTTGDASKSAVADGVFYMPSLGNMRGEGQATSTKSVEVTAGLSLDTESDDDDNNNDNNNNDNNVYGTNKTTKK